MLSTGVIRRMDDLGRVVIPKEIRKKVHISYGDAFEIYIDKDNNIIALKPYLPAGGRPWEMLEDLCDELELSDDYDSFIPEIHHLAEEMKKSASN